MKNNYWFFIKPILGVLSLMLYAISGWAQCALSITQVEYNADAGNGGIGIYANTTGVTPQFELRRSDNSVVASWQNLGPIGNNRFQWGQAGNSPGTYTLSIRPSDNTSSVCTFTFTLTGTNSTGILYPTTGCTPPTAPSITASSLNVCNTVTLTASGCSGTVNWSNGASGSTTTVMASGNYTASCSAGGCASSPSNTITLSSCPGGGGGSCASSITQVEYNADAGNGGIGIYANTTGVTPQFELRRSDNSVVASWQNLGPIGNNRFQWGQAGNSPGTYTLSIRPSDNTSSVCTFTFTLTGTNSTGILYPTTGCTPPTAPSITASSLNVCNTVTLTASGCSGTVNWSNGASGSTTTVMASGNYTASCSAGGCASSPSNTITLSSCPGGGGGSCASSITQVEYNADAGNGGIGIYANTTGVTPQFELRRSDNSVVASWQNLGPIGNNRFQWGQAGNSPGTYTLSIRPSDNTSSVCTFTFTLTGTNSTGILYPTTGCTPPTAPSITASSLNVCNTVTLTASGCSGTVNWSNGASGTQISVNAAATYTATCSANGCTSGASNVITTTGCSTPPANNSSMRDNVWVGHNLFVNDSGFKDANGNIIRDADGNITSSNRANENLIDASKAAGCNIVGIVYNITGIAYNGYSLFDIVANYAASVGMKIRLHIWVDQNLDMLQNDNSGIARFMYNPLPPLQGINIVQTIDQNSQMHYGPGNILMLSAYDDAALNWQKECVNRISNHVKAQPWYSSVIVAGIGLSATGEMQYNGEDLNQNPPTLLTGYDLPALTAFRTTQLPAWYGTIQALNQAYSMSYNSFNEVNFPQPNGTSDNSAINTAFNGTRGKDFYRNREIGLARVLAGLHGVLRQNLTGVPLMGDSGSFSDDQTPRRGTANPIAVYGNFADGRKANGAIDVNNRYWMDAARAGLGANGFWANELDITGPGATAPVAEQYTQAKESIEWGATLITLNGWHDRPQDTKVSDLMTVSVDKYGTSGLTIPQMIARGPQRTAYGSTIYLSRDNQVRLDNRVAETLWNNAYNSNGNKPVKITYEMPDGTTAGGRLAALPENEKQVTVFPNPVEEKLKVQFNLIKSGEARFFIMDLAGRPIYHYNHSGNSGINNLELDIHNINPGMYILQTIVGQDSFVTKIIKN